MALAGEVDKHTRPPGHSWHVIRRRMRRHAAAIAFVVAVAVLVLTPLVSLVFIALHGDEDIWGHLAAYVLPVALKDTALLLAGVAAVTPPLRIRTALVVSPHPLSAPSRPLP